MSLTSLGATALWDLLPDGTAMATQQSMELFLNVLEFFLV